MPRSELQASLEPLTTQLAVLLFSPQRIVFMTTPPKRLQQMSYLFRTRMERPARIRTLIASTIRLDAGRHRSALLRKIGPRTYSRTISHGITRIMS